MFGRGRSGFASQIGGAFQHLAVLPDGSRVVFELNKSLALIASFTPEPPVEGIFIVNADGSGLRRLGPPSRYPTLFPFPDARGVEVTGTVWSVSPGGRSLTLIDFGPDTAGREAPQVFLLDLRSGRRRQLTHLPPSADRLQGIRFPRFLDRGTIGFYGGSAPTLVPLKAYQVRTDGSGLREIGGPVLIPGARVVPQFTVTGSRAQVALVTFPDKRPVNPIFGDAVSELFLKDGRHLLQLTNFGRSDTGLNYSFVAWGRVFFVATADPLGENPDELCQVFSVDKFGGGLRQETRLPFDGRPYRGCYPGDDTGCTIEPFSLLPDRLTGTLAFGSSCDPLGRNRFGSQIFSMRPDGSGLRQLTATRGRTIDPDGTLHVEIPGPLAYQVLPSIALSAFTFRAGAAQSSHAGQPRSGTEGLPDQ
jgi:hypothetical protein